MLNTNPVIPTEKSSGLDLRALLKEHEGRNAFEDMLTQMHRFPGLAWEVIADIGRNAVTARAR
jgi:hypothetical protein